MYISNNNLWDSEFDNIVSKKDKIQDMNINQLKFEVIDTNKKDEKITTNFEPTDDSVVINKFYLDKIEVLDKKVKIDGHLSLIENIRINLEYLPTNTLYKKS